MNKPQPRTEAGYYRRRIILDASSGHSVHAALEDDYHHFVLQLEHDGERVTAVSSEAKRIPWTSCPAASGQLVQLVGLAISRDILVNSAGIDAYTQCTHQFDLGLMAIAQAARDGSRRYDVSISDPRDGLSTATLDIDGKLQLEWVMEGSTIVAPARDAGTNLRSLKLREVAMRDPEVAEHIALLRRAVMVAGGRAFDLDQVDSPMPFAARMSGACFAYQPERIAFARRNPGSIRDFSASAERLLPDF